MSKNGPFRGGVGGGHGDLTTKKNYSLYDANENGPYKIPLLLPGTTKAIYYCGILNFGRMAVTLALFLPTAECPSAFKSAKLINLLIQFLSALFPSFLSCVPASMTEGGGLPFRSCFRSSPAAVPQLFRSSSAAVPKEVKHSKRSSLSRWCFIVYESYPRRRFSSGFYPFFALSVFPKSKSFWLQANMRAWTGRHRDQREPFQ